MEVKLVFLPHRVEFLNLLREEVNGYDALILEEPYNIFLERYLKGIMSLEEYVRLSDTNFPLYTFYQAKLLKNLHDEGIKILQIEPYLEVIEKIHTSIKTGKFREYTSNPEVRKVLDVEREVVGKLIEYQEALMKSDFDHIVDKVIEFTKRDSERFKLRDYMRAMEISKLGENGKIVVEAGYMHVLLPIFLRELNIKLESVNLLEKACKILNIEYSENPGDILAKAYMLKQDLKDNDRLLAAQSLIYVSMISKDEKLPSPDKPYPHLIEETEISRRVRAMSYEECRKEFMRILKKSNLRL